MLKCDGCLNSHIILSENGRHSICTLSQKKAMDCIMGKEDQYIRHPAIKEENDEDE